MMFIQSHINRGFWALLFVFLPTYIFSQDALERTWLWQVSGGELEGKSFIFGTTPVQDSTFFKFSNQVWKSMGKTDVFASFEQEDVPAYQPYYDASFGEFEKHYGLTPALYLQSIAKQDFKPTVALSAENTMANLFASGADSTPKSTKLGQRKMLHEAYVTANLEEFVNLRKKMDVPESVYQRLTSRNNYKIINELIDKMRLQPVFVAIDGIYLPGQEGLVNLLRARGFQVRPIGVKEYAKVTQQIEQQKLMQAQWEQQSQPQTPATVPTNQEPGNQTISAPTTATQNIKLDLPMGVLNLAQWSNYDLLEGKYQYSAPRKLKSGDRDGRYKASNGGLTYQIDVVEKWENLPTAIERLIIQNGGQLVMEKNFMHNGVTGRLIELMYAEKQISKHVLLNGIEKNVIISVRGETPVIHTVLADRFLQSFHLEQLPPQSSGGVNVNLPNIFGGGKGQKEQEPAVVVPQWSAASLNGLQFAFPADYEEQESKTADGKVVKAFISSRAVDQNTFLVVNSEKEAFDNFRLFNNAINTAAQEVRGVVAERNVMPDGRSDFAEYLVKDAVGNFYRIQYIYRNNSLFQIIAKGDKKSVYNANAQRFFQSIILY